MAITKDQLRASNSNAFPNNNSQAITPEILRNFNDEMINSLVDEVTFSGSTEPMISESLATASFDIGTRDLTFTKNNGTTFDVNIPGGGGGGSADTGSLLITASVLDADITFTKGDGSQFSILVNNVSESVNAQHADTVQLPVIAKETLTKGDPVYISGYNVGQARPEVLKADASNPSKMPAVGLVIVDAVNNDQILISVAGSFPNSDTVTNLSNPQVGETLYVASGGGYTNAKPVGTDLIQNIGIIGRVQQNTGEILVSCIQRANDLPNIAQGNIWLGDGDGVPQPFSTSSIAFTDKNNTFSGNQTFNNITVEGTGSFAYIQSVTGSAKIIGDAFIQLNTDTPTVRFGGIKVIDSGSFGGTGTGSIEYDSETNHWLYVGEDGTSAGFISGPTGSDKSNITHLTDGVMPVANSDNHLYDSPISQLNTNTVVVASNLIAKTSLQTSGSDGKSFVDISSSNNGNGSNQFLMQQNNLGAQTLFQQNDGDGGQFFQMAKGGAGQIVMNLNGTSGEAFGQFANGQTNQSATVNNAFIEIADQASGIDRRIILAAKSSNIPGAGLTNPNPSLSIATGGGIQEVLQFQDASNYTNGTVIVQTPMQFSGSITGSTTKYDDLYLSGGLYTSPQSPVAIGQQPTVANFGEFPFVKLPTYTGINGLGGADYDNNSIVFKGNSSGTDAGGISTQFLGGGGSFFSVTKQAPLYFGSAIQPSGSTGQYVQAFGQVQYPGGVPQTMYVIDSENILVGTNVPNASIEFGNPAYSTPISFNTTLRVGNPGSGYNPQFSANIDGTMTASLEQGYVWVGDSNGQTITAATSSFGGGGGGPATVTSVTPSGGTATLDLSLGTKFYLDVPSGTSTTIAVSNRVDGESFSLLLSQSSASTGSIDFTDDTIKFAGGLDYQATNQTSAEDILSFEIYNKADGASNKYVYATSVKNLV